jgi:hypothetical protein
VLDLNNWYVSPSGVERITARPHAAAILFFHSDFLSSGFRPGSPRETEAEDTPTYRR